MHNENATVFRSVPRAQKITDLVVVPAHATGVTKVAMASGQRRATLVGNWEEDAALRAANAAAALAADEGSVTARRVMGTDTTAKGGTPRMSVTAETMRGGAVRAPARSRLQRGVAPRMARALRLEAAAAAADAAERLKAAEEAKLREANDARFAGVVCSHRNVLLDEGSDDDGGGEFPIEGAAITAWDADGSGRNRRSSAFTAPVGGEPVGGVSGEAWRT